MANRTAFFTTLSTLLSVSPLLINTVATAAMINVSDAEPGSLVITEYLANPIGVSDSQAEYFEVFNATNTDIELTDLIVRDDGSNEFTVSGICIDAGSFAVFSNSDGAALGLAPDFIYGSSMNLTNGDDEIGLFRPDGVLISKVSYTDGDFFGDGIAHELVQLNSATQTLLFGPSIGIDFMASVTALPLGNFGSPGNAGGTSFDTPAVPIPSAVWMFGSALSILGWLKRRIARVRAHSKGESNATYDWPNPQGPFSKGPLSIGRMYCRSGAPELRTGGMGGI